MTGSNYFTNAAKTLAIEVVYYHACDDITVITYEIPSQDSMTIIDYSGEEARNTLAYIKKTYHKKW